MNYLKTKFDNVCRLYQESIFTSDNNDHLDYNENILCKEINDFVLEVTPISKSVDQVLILSARIINYLIHDWRNIQHLTDFDNRFTPDYIINRDDLNEKEHFIIRDIIYWTDSSKQYFSIAPYIYSTYKLKSYDLVLLMEQYKEMLAKNLEIETNPRIITVITELIDLYDHIIPEIENIINDIENRLGEFKKNLES